MLGFVTRLTDKGFGFILADDPKQVFFHSNSLVGLLFDELREGDFVTFETSAGPKGRVAVNVQRSHDLRRQDELIVVGPGAGPTLSPAEAGAIESVRTVTNELIQSLNRNPDDLYRLHPKIFEELIVEVFNSQGYAAELVSSWNQADGGVDIIAVRRDFAGFPIRYAIQCKRYSAQRLVTADPIRALAGILDRFEAHVGVVATTSYFTKPAEDEARTHLWKISLVDYRHVVASLKRLELVRGE